MPAIFDPTNPDIIQNPYPVYSKLRREDPVHWNPKGFWFVSRYDDVRACLKDNRLSNRPAPFALVNERNRNRFAAADIANNLIAFMDAPEHTRLRGWVARAFVGRTRNKEAQINALAEAHAKALEGLGRTDLISAFAVPFACHSICSILGFPEKDASRIAGWSDDFFKLFHAIPTAEEFAALNSSLREFREYVLDAVSYKTSRLGDDLISDLLRSNSDVTCHREIADNIMLLAADGIGNVQSGLANCVHVLLQHCPTCNFDESAPQDLSRVIDECLRLESPGQYQGRITKDPFELAGREIRGRSIVLLGLASANRDEAVFRVPQDFRPTQDRKPHLAFGHGPHMCLGNGLVRLELGAALRALFSSKRRVATADESPEWLARPGHRWLKSLHIEME